MNLWMLLAGGVVAGLALLAPPGSACADHGVADMRLADQAVAHILPCAVHTARPALLVVLHGAGQQPDQMIAQFKATRIGRAWFCWRRNPPGRHGTSLPRLR